MAADNIGYYVFLVIFILQTVFLEPCEASSYSYSWWSMWYFWVIMFGILACCCGAGGSYYRRKRLMQMQNGRCTTVVGAYPGQTNYQQGTVGMYPTGAQPYGPSVVAGQPPNMGGMYQAQTNPGFTPAPYPVQQTAVPAAFQPPPNYSTVTTDPAYNKTDAKDLPPPPAYSEIATQQPQAPKIGDNLAPGAQS